jgi:hypothetical protein
MVPKLSPKRRDRLEILTTTEGPLHGFESLPAQEFIIRTATEHMEATLAEDTLMYMRDASSTSG